MSDVTDANHPGGGADSSGRYEPQPAWPEQAGPELGSTERRRRWLRVAAVMGGVVGVSLTAVWLTRDRIADNLISAQLQRLGVPATYRIESIGPRRQVIGQIVIGLPGHPDLTAEQAIIEIRPRLGYPAIGRITLVRPRLYGRMAGGRISFGTLDKVLYSGKTEEPLRLPDLDIAVVDGRGRVLGDQGPVGFVLEGAGRLRGGFAGSFAAVAPRLLLAGCRADGTSLYGRVTIAAEKPRFVGPARMASLVCAGTGTLRGARLDIDGTADAALDGGTARLGIATGAIGGAPGTSRGLNGTVVAAWRAGVLSARYDLLARGLDTAQASAATLAAKGTLRARGGFARTEIDAEIDGGGLRLGNGAAGLLAAYEKAGEGSLVAPVLGQIRTALLREGRASRLFANVLVHRSGGQTNVIVPQGRLIGGSGATLLALSRVQYSSGMGTTPRLAGNFTTGGVGLPRMTGRMNKGPAGDTIVTLAMAEYRAGPARIALPHFVVAQTTNGALGFSGTAIASGPLPGGRVENLVLPIDGNRSPRGVLALWRACTTVRFDALAYADLALERRSLLLCPGPGGAMVRSDGSAVRVALGTPSVDLAGRLGQTPIRIASGPVGLSLPGALYARALDVTLGPADTATHFRLADLKAQIGREVSGTFAGADIRLAAVPIDMLDASGKWRFAAGTLDINDAAFRVEDRQQVDRFQPLAAGGGTLTLVNNHITANALLSEPSSKREVLNVVVRHDLGSGRGHADLVVNGLLFDRALQPDMLSRTLLGVVANASGTLRGRGVIDWTPEAVTSSGRFGTDALDFAAAFGPVKGVSGNVEFSDLINFVTPPGQRLHIAAINPGIEVGNGDLLFQLKPDLRLAVEGGSWPFLGGTLNLRPVDLNLGVAETRRYVLDIEQLDAAKFVQQMELANLSATGTFDGSLPLVFDENGGRIDGGILTSRRPGGNVSYVGALTYKDLSPIANFAFDALKSLDYRQMRIAMDGALEGNIVTRVRFDGVKQGEGAKRNFVTRRFANLPLQFNVNVRAPFYQLITSFKAMYDPAYVKDPRTIGLLDANGKPLAAPVPPRPRIQPPVSENKP